MQNSELFLHIQYYISPVEYCADVGLVLIKSEDPLGQAVILPNRYLTAIV